MNSVVIGAGISGIATAIRLALLNIDVTVIEQHHMPGGKLSQMEKNGYRFDMGPSLFTMPEYVDEMFQLAGKDPAQHFRYSRLDNVTRYFFEDGTVINAWADAEKLAEELEQKTSTEKSRAMRFLRKSKRLYNLTKDVFIHSSLHIVGNYFTKKFFKAYAHAYELNAFQSMHKENSRWFKDKRVVQMFDRYATYNGSNPYVAPATLNVIPHLEHCIGGFFPEKGMYQIITSLKELADSVGVQFVFDTKAGKVTLENGAVKSVVAGGEEYPADIIVSGIDVHQFYTHLLPDQKRVRKIEKQERSSSALIFYWGVKKEFPQLDLHNIFFSAHYKEEFDGIFRDKYPVDDPTVYLFISSKLVKTDAPEGCENWFVMINVPENNGQNWDEIIERSRRNILRKIKSVLGEDIEPLIDFEDVLDPRLIEQRTSSYRGSLYGSSSNSMFSAFGRHPNFSQKIKGLYFSGGSVHPGGGIPLCLSSARIIEGLVRKNFKIRK
jgi:phytoene desaturase